MKKNILIVGPTSEIAKKYIEAVKNEFKIFSISRRKINNINIEKNYIFNHLSEISKKNFHKKKFDKVIYFIGHQIDATKKISNIKNKKIFNTFVVNSIFPIKLTYSLIENNNLTKKPNIIFFSSRSGSISERGKLKHHKAGGNHIYRASKSLLNSFVKNLSFEFKKKDYIFVSYHPGWVATKSAKGKMPVETSVKYFINFCKNLKKKDSGNFFNFDKKKLPW